MSTWDAIDQLRKNKQENFLTTLHLQESFWTWIAKTRKRLKGGQIGSTEEEYLIHTHRIQLERNRRCQNKHWYRCSAQIYAVNFTAIKSISTDSSSNCIFFYLNCNCDFCKGDLFPNLLWPQFFNRHLILRPTEKNHFCPSKNVFSIFIYMFFVLR